MALQPCLAVALPAPRSTTGHGLALPLHTNSTYKLQLQGGSCSGLHPSHPPCLSALPPSCCRVRDNLHVVLCFSPVGDKFARRAQQFPGLINGCTIDWFMPWPEEALTSVSGKFIDEFHMACDATAKGALKQMMAHVHVFVTAACHEYFEKFRRHVYVTPKSYLSFIQVGLAPSACCLLPGPSQACRNYVYLSITLHMHVNACCDT